MQLRKSKKKIDGEILKINSKNKSLAIEHLANDSISHTENKNNLYSIGWVKTANSSRSWRIPGEARLKGI